MPTDARAPSHIVAGDTVAFTVPAFQDAAHEWIAPSTGWTIVYRLVGSTVIEASGVAVGDTWSVTLSAALTDDLSAGDATAFVIASHTDGRRLTRQQPSVVIAPNPATLASGSGTTWAARTLTVVEHVLETGVLPAGITSYMVGDQQVAIMPPAALMKLRNQLRAEIAASRTSTGSAMFGVPVRFTPVRGVL